MASDSSIPLAARQLVYRVLVDEFGFAADVPMAKVAAALMDAGIDKEDYGYAKLKAFLADLDDFLAFTDIMANGVPQRLVTINKRDDWPGARPGDARRRDDAGDGQDEGAGRNDAGPSDSIGPNYAERAAASPAYISGSLPRGIADELRPRLSDFAFLPPATLEVLSSCTPPATDVRALLEEDWAVAYDAGALRYYEGKVIFPLRIARADGTTPIEASIRHVSYENPEEKPWYLCYIDDYVRPARPKRPVVPGKELERFAWLGPWDAFLESLAALALPEPWDFDGPGADGRRHAILKSYICTTFFRLKLEDKVAVDEDAGFAAFNTGLVTRRYDDIYACFEPGSGASPWRFADFCTSGSRGMGKCLVSLFSPLPEPASYFDRKEDLLFDLEKDLVIDFDHVLIDNMARLPFEFLEDELHGIDEARRLLDDARTDDAERRAACFEQLGRIVEDDARLFRRLRSRLKDAVDIARKRVRWNFKTAIPSYYPRANAMSLLLPLCLTDDDRVDAALVVQLMPSGNYQGQTVLTIEQAYTNARLICRPDSDWLTAARP